MDSAQLFSFVATENCEVLCGLKIDFLDIDPDAIEKAAESFNKIIDSKDTNMGIEKKTEYNSANGKVEIA